MSSAKIFNRTKIFILSILILAFTGNAYAYIDPGSLGSAYQFGYLIFYSIVGGLLFLFQPIKNFVTSIFKSKKDQKNKETVKEEENSNNEAAY